MKTRVLSSVAGLVILAVVIAFLDTFVLNIAIGLLALIAVWELIHATKMEKPPALPVLAAAGTLLSLFARTPAVFAVLPEAVFLLLLCLFVVLLRCHAAIHIEQVAMIVLFSTVVPLFFSCAVYMREDHGVVLGCFYLLIALGAAWLCDTAAYFTGMCIGRHKLAPILSPKKTVEGAVGGLVFGTLFLLLLAWGFAWAAGALGFSVQIFYVRLLCVSPVFAMFGMLGDLTASAIKRGCGIKDYGHIMPGHGGVLDRFDSTLFTLPCVYLVSRHLALAVLIAA